MKVELAARTSQTGKAEETPPPSPAAVAGASAAEDAPLLPDGGVRRRAGCGRFAQRSVSFRREVGRAAAETFLLTRLTLILLRYLGIGYRWIQQFLALCCYTFLLMPGFIQVVYYYFFSSQVHRSVVYGDQPRNRLDLYIPTSMTGLKPVVAFVTGGAWIIGYKGWGALLGRRLAERGIIVACIDYRNFPQGTIGDMVEDASQGISFVCNSIASYGGDPNRIYLVGQSAGAHIAACALLNQAIRECGEGDTSSWSVSQIKAYFGISGGYNLLNLVDHFHRRGLYRSIFLSIMEGEESLQKFSPQMMIKESSARSAVSLLPHIILFHGTSDCSIPSAESQAFADALQQHGAKADLFLYEGKTHTDLFLQDPLRGGRDKMLEEIASVIHSEDPGVSADHLAVPVARRLVPEFMLKLAGRGFFMDPCRAHAGTNKVKNAPASSSSSSNAQSPDLQCSALLSLAVFYIVGIQFT
ncbi:putative isoprenylcysteine alpha-carbonyl methylesterase ICMEL1 [Panicum miliaceum]|uniref:protein-S-isoprenylcysteine alpha-carbonyl methylesterase n=1 Tax=Panicum miliaceum TaxID=4540 RepID=A0A3L6RYN0_PANMI|nr:putative isoprenylcysteine alpha-carbonyl methylesterase ICMEL1 [Panicum miliaceum]